MATQERARIATKRTGVAVLVISTCLAIATSAFHAPRWLGIVAVAIMGIALVWLAFQAPEIARRIPFRIRRHDPELDAVLGRLLDRHLLRQDLQAAFSTITEMKDPDLPELRAFADNLARRLQNDGHDMTAKRVEVHLTDDASAAAIEKRREELRDELLAMLIWDRFA